MKLRAPLLKIESTDPFSEDLLERKGLAESMTALAKTADDGLVVALDAAWGSGKTTFLSMWSEELRATGFQVIAFNAWETDIAEDALVALLGELDAGIKALASRSSNVALSSSLSKAKAIGARLLRNAVPAAVRVATAGALDLDDLSEDVISELSGKIAEEQIAAYEAARNSIQSFRKSIADIAQAATQREEGEQRLPLIFLIDELDRCRPTYAVRILECVKHFFSVPGVFFVLAVDGSQLRHTVRSQYGHEMDADGYLRRFFDIELSLPEPEKNLFSEAQFKRFGIDKIFAERRAYSRSGSDDHFAIQTTFTWLFKLTNCSLRDRERCFAILSFAMRATPKNFHIYPMALAALIVIKVKRRDLYVAVKNGTTTGAEVIAELRRAPGAAEFLATNQGLWLQVSLLAVFKKEHSLDEEIKQCIADANDEQKINDRAANNQLMQRLSSSEAREMIGNLAYLLSKIDLFAQ